MFSPAGGITTEFPGKQCDRARSYVKKTLQHVEIGEDEESGKWSLDVMFGNALHIEKNMRQVIRDCGFQSEDASKPGYIHLV